MSQNVPPSFQVKFQNNVEMAVQQQQTPIERAGAVMIQEDRGMEKVKIKDIVGNTEAKESSGRHGKTKWNNRTYDGIWVPKTPELYDAALVDDEDQLQTAIQLGSTETMAAGGTLARARTRRFLEGFYGDVITGKHGTITQAMPSSQIIPVTVGGATGPQKNNLKKVREAKKLLDEAFVDKTKKRFMVCTAEDNDAWYDEIMAMSSDFQRSFGARTDDDGNVLAVLGFTMIHEELDNPLLSTIPDLATDANGYRKTPFWVEGGLAANYWRRLRTRVGEIAEMEFSMGYLAGTTLTATRTQPEMSGIILNRKD